MHKSLKTAEIIPFDKHAGSAKTSKQKKKKSPLEIKAYQAFHNARQRCENPKNKSFPGYGGKGIKFLLDSFEDFIAAIGLPPNAKASLDRIDPNGHYAAGNIRWASKAVQAANKSFSPLSSFGGLEAMVASAKATTAQPKVHRLATDCWNAMIGAIGVGAFTTSDRLILRSHPAAVQIADAGWEFGQMRDQTAVESYFHLPSITAPGQSVRLLGGPFSPNPLYSKNGLIDGLGRLDFELTIDGWVGEAIKAGRASKEELGTCFVGQLPPALLLRGGLEGQMLAVASRTRRLGETSALFPVLTVLDKLNKLGSPWIWDEAEDAILKVRHLFIPDFQIDLGQNGALDNLQNSRLLTLLKYRFKHGFRTFLGIQNVQQVPPSLRGFVLSSLHVCDVSKAYSIHSSPFAKNVAPTTNPLSPKRKSFQYLLSEIP